MFLTGIADEAGSDLATQISATKELNWKYIESRAIGSKDLSSISEAEFADVCCQLAESKIKINCYGSGIANYKCHPRSFDDFEACKRELLAVIPRMQKLNIKMLRGMSFLVPKNEPPDSPALEKIIFKKLDELARICEDAGIIFGHENCANYGGLSYLHTLKMLENVKNDNFKLILDTGNPICSFHRVGKKPYGLQSPWEFYKNVREFIVYVHIKDAYFTASDDGKKPQGYYTYPGNGCGDIKAILIDLLKNGYDGGFSIEPHMGITYAKLQNSSEKELTEYKFRNYIEYGRHFEKLLADCVDDVKHGK